MYPLQQVRQYIIRNMTASANYLGPKHSISILAISSKLWLSSWCHACDRVLLQEENFLRQAAWGANLQTHA